MVLKPKYIAFSFLTLLLLLALSCSQNKKEQSDDLKIENNTKLPDNLATVISFDTLHTQAVRTIVDGKIALLQNNESEQGLAFLNYFIGKKYLISKNRDSVYISEKLTT